MSFYILLFVEFFKIGLLSIGGGLATLPFLYQLADKYDWFDASKITDMIALSESTPGPIGINLATFTGVQHSGIIGGLVATVGIVTPSVIIIILVSKFLDKFNENIHIKDIFSALRPAVIGLIASVGLGVIIQSLYNTAAYNETGNILSGMQYKEIILFALLIFFTNKFDRHPLFYIIISAIIGIIFAF